MDEWDECSACIYYDTEDERCTAFTCDWLDCDAPLPCEDNEDA